VEVLTSRQTGAIVTFGDLIRDGTQSTAGRQQPMAGPQKETHRRNENEKSVEKRIN